MKYSNYNAVKEHCDTLIKKADKLAFLYAQLQEWERSKPSKRMEFLNFESVYERAIRLINIDIKAIELLSDCADPILHTIYGTNKIQLTAAHKLLTEAKLLTCSPDIWLYRFGGFPCTNTDEKIRWIYNKGEKRALSYFVEKITKTHTIDWAASRKIFDVQIFTKDRYKCTYSQIDNLINKK